ncbi:MAG: ion transporter [Candidatus Binatia bacterium]
MVNAAAMGLETSAAVMASYGRWLLAANAAIQALFVVEIALRLAASRPVRAFFRDGWNTFDFVVVVGSLLPVAGPFAALGRLARVLRVARLVSASHDLRLIIATMLRSIPSLGHVVLLLGVLLYVYAIVGVHAFGAHDAARWGSLGAALLSLFQVLTLEGWPEMQTALLAVVPWAWVYFASFVIIAVFVVINLFIAVVINNLQTVQGEQRAAAAGADAGALLEESARLRQRLEQFEASLQAQAAGEGRRAA